MSTNFYSTEEHCQGKIVKHIGKVLTSYTFLFAEHPGIDSFVDWKDYLEQPNVSIRDEFGYKYSFSKFSKMVEIRQSNAPKQFNLVSRKNRRDLQGYWFFASDNADWS